MITLTVLGKGLGPTLIKFKFESNGFCVCPICFKICVLIFCARILKWIAWIVQMRNLTDSNLTPMNVDHKLFPKHSATKLCYEILSQTVPHYFVSTSKHNLKKYRTFEWGNMRRSDRNYIKFRLISCHNRLICVKNIKNFVHIKCTNLDTHYSSGRILDWIWSNRPQSLELVEALGWILLLIRSVNY